MALAPPTDRECTRGLISLTKLLEAVRRYDSEFGRKTPFGLEVSCLRLRLRQQLIILTQMDSVLLANEALKLPAWERAQIIDALWRSLDPAEQASIDQAWLVESRDRLRACKESRFKALDGEEALREIEDGV